MIHGMKSISFLKLCLLVCISLVINVKAQERPDRPVIEKVSIDPHTGLITIDWDVQKPPSSPPSPDVEEFWLFWHETQPSPTNNVFAVIKNPAVRSYTFDFDTTKLRLPTMPDPRTTSVPFTVAAVNRTKSTTPPWYSSSLRSVEHYNMQLSSNYDSCRAEIKLNWYPYVGWITNNQPYQPLVSYHVMSIEGSQEVEIKVLSESDTTFTIRDVMENSKYAYYIIAKRGDGETATCYRTTIDTKMPIQSSFIYAVNTQYNAQGHAEISFKLDPHTQTHSYEFSGTSNYDYSFVRLGTFDIYSDTVLTDLQIREKTHYYMLEAWHVCKNKFTAKSNVATALWLSLKQDGQDNVLQWDPYLSWNDNAKYEIYRQIGSNLEEIITTVYDPSTTTYVDDMSIVEIDGEVCYWIVATPVSVSTGMSDQFAISNRTCIEPESNVFIPTAFTPNGDGQNDIYKPSFSPVDPKEYLLILFDRTGAKVFETKNPNEGWNGQLMNGRPANEGVYTYYLRFRTAIGRLFERSGTFVLMLP